MTAEEILDAALTKIESQSIREWVQSQKEVWIRLGIKPIMENHSGKSKEEIVNRVEILIMCNAIG